MNYIYDIYANINKKYYDIYDWQKKDKIIHIKKIPIFKIKSSDLQKFIKDEIKLDETFVKIIKNKTEFFNNNLNSNFCAFTDTRDEIIIKISNNGNIIGKSSIHFTDRYNATNAFKKINLSNIDYKITKVIPLDSENRYEKIRRNFLMKNIDILSKEKLTYLYFECFEQKVDNEKIIKNHLKKEIVKQNEKVCTTISNFLKLICAPN